jgi:AraC-like DNA-binding protein
MLFQFGPRSALLLPFVVPGAVATAWLLARAARRGTWPDALLALLILIPTLTIVQWMLGFAGWYDSHNGYSTAMFYIPWQLNLLLGPAYYFYFRSLTSQEFRLGPRAWWHFGLGLVRIALVGVAAAYDLGWWRALQGRALPHHFGTKGPVVELLDGLNRPIGYVLYGLLPLYCWWVLADYRRYTRYLNDNFSDPERLRFAGFRQLLLLQIGSLALSLLFEVLDLIFNLGYAEAWNYYALRGLFIYALIVVGIQANYAAATSPLRFDPDTLPSEATEPLAPAVAPTTDFATIEAHAIVEVGDTLAAEKVEPPEQSHGAAPPAPTDLPALAPELLAWRDKLLALMAAEQPWLEPELTLTELAQRLHTNPGLLSKVINAGCGQNFNDFVNTYRVREARRKLADARFAHYSLVGVALESGFNSKSTFNRVFKKLTGQAPSEVARPKS